MQAEYAVPAQAIMAMTKDEALNKRRASGIRSPPNEYSPARQRPGGAAYTTATVISPQPLPRSLRSFAQSPPRSQYAPRKTAESPDEASNHGRHNSQPGAGRHHRRRHRRLQHRLSPGATRLEGCRAARAPAAHLRHDLARGGAG